MMKKENTPKKKWYWYAGVGGGAAVCFNGLEFLAKVWHKGAAT